MPICVREESGPNGARDPTAETRHKWFRFQDALSGRLVERAGGSEGARKVVVAPHGAQSHLPVPPCRPRYGPGGPGLSGFCCWMPSTQ